MKKSDLYYIQAQVRNMQVGLEQIAGLLEDEFGNGHDVFLKSVDCTHLVARFRDYLDHLVENRTRDNN